MGEKGEKTADAGLSRRDMIKRTAVAGGIAWAAPTLWAAPAGAVQTGPGCQECENDGILYYVKIASASSANCGQACIDLGTYDSKPGEPRCGTCLFESGAITFVVTESFTNGQTRKARVTLDPRLRLVETGAQFKGDCHNVVCTNGFVQDPPPGPGRPTITVVQGTQPVPPDNPGTPTVIDYIASAAVNAPIKDIDPLNHVALIVCFPFGGTDFPGC